MTKIEQAKYDAFIQVLTYFDANKEIISQVQAVETLLSSARLMVNNINITEKQRTEKKEGHTNVKQVEKDNLIFTATGIADVIYGYADINKNLPLKAAADINKTELDEAGDNLSRIARNILDMAKANADNLKEFGISEALLENYSQMISRYELSATMPRTVETENIDATKKMKALFRGATHLFNEQLYPLMSIYKLTNRQFYEGYITRQQVLDPVTRHTRISGVITAATGEPLKDAVVKIATLDLHDMTDENGKYDMRVSYSKSLIIAVTATGYNTKEAQVTLRKGKTTRVDLELNKSA